VPGTYLFTWTATINGFELSTQLVIQIKGGLEINGPRITAEEKSIGEYDSSTGVFIYRMKAGDTAKIHLINGEVEGGYSSFSGWLLF
jgi:hypothetical protein